MLFRIIGMIINVALRIGVYQIHNDNSNLLMKPSFSLFLLQMQNCLRKRYDWKNSKSFPRCLLA